ncbi:hypothetical protein [Gemmata obscuriglobus]|uniref:hypothetical protein n=1 Tax=Gemmata obscuriglobus TaxID=114 RepID=UPI00016C48AE|nr:hypothetical protein [Gemmata obscuriglobus]VTS09952.1 unnamed protein product [Gemmata obscuriglobus UQM 2246]
MARTRSTSATFTTSLYPLGSMSYPSTGCPPAHLPVRRVAAILSRVRSEMISRSNCANDRSMLSTSRPMEVAVLNCWVTDTNATCCC